MKKHKKTEILLPYESSELQTKVGKYKNTT
jgi:hypothetical protein